MTMRLLFLSAAALAIGCAPGDDWAGADESANAKQTSQSTKWDGKEGRECTEGDSVQKGDCIYTCENSEWTTEDPECWKDAKSCDEGEVVEKGDCIYTCVDNEWIADDPDCDPARDKD